MLKELKGQQEINQFFEELNEKPAGKIQKARIYGMALREQERTEQEIAIEKVIKQRISNRIENVTIIDESMAVVETIYDIEEEESVFFAFVNGQAHMEGVKTFDQCVALALCVKYGFPILHLGIVNMLKMDR